MAETIGSGTNRGTSPGGAKKKKKPLTVLPGLSDAPSYVPPSSGSTSSSTPSSLSSNPLAGPVYAEAPQTRVPQLREIKPDQFDDTDNTLRERRKPSTSELLGQMRERLGGNEAVFNDLAGNLVYEELNKRRRNVKQTLRQHRNRVERVYTKAGQKAFDGDLEWLDRYKERNPGVLQAPRYRDNYPGKGINRMVREAEQDILQYDDPYTQGHLSDAHQMEITHQSQIKGSYQFNREQIVRFRDKFRKTLRDSENYQSGRGGNKDGDKDEHVKGRAHLSEAQANADANTRNRENNEYDLIASSLVGEDPITRMMAPEAFTDTDDFARQYFDKSPSHMSKREKRAHPQLARGYKQVRRFSNVKGSKNKDLPSTQDLIAMRVESGELDPTDDNAMDRWTRNYSNPYNPEYRNAVVQYKTAVGEWDMDKPGAEDEAVRFINAPLDLYNRRTNKRPSTMSQSDVDPTKDEGLIPDDVEMGLKIGMGQAAKASPVSAGFTTPEGKSALHWTVDKLSRPLNAFADVANYYYGLDEEVNDRSGISDAAFGGMLGQNPFASLDDVGTGDLLQMLTIGREGMKDGGWGNMENPTGFTDVVRANAERNTDKTFHDNPYYQVGAGLFADLTLDPLNAVPLGIPTKISRAAVGAKGTQEIAESEARVGGLVKRFETDTMPEGETLDPQTLERFFSPDNSILTHPGHAKDLEDQPLRKAGGQVDQAELDEYDQAIDYLYTQQREAVSNVSDETYLDDLADTFNEQVSKGEITPDDFAEIEHSIRANQFRHQRLSELNDLRSANNRTAKELGFTSKTPEGKPYADYTRVLDKQEALARRGNEFAAAGDNTSAEYLQYQREANEWDALLSTAQEKAGVKGTFTDIMRKASPGWDQSGISETDLQRIASTFTRKMDDDYRAVRSEYYTSDNAIKNMRREGKPVPDNLDQRHRYVSARKATQEADAFLRAVGGAVKAHAGESITTDVGTYGALSGLRDRLRNVLEAGDVSSSAGMGAKSSDPTPELRGDFNMREEEALEYEANAPSTTPESENFLDEAFDKRGNLQLSVDDLEDWLTDGERGGDTFRKAEMLSSKVDRALKQLEHVTFNDGGQLELRSLPSARTLNLSDEIDDQYKNAEFLQDNFKWNNGQVTYTDSTVAPERQLHIIQQSLQEMYDKVYTGLLKSSKSSAKDAARQKIEKGTFEYEHEQHLDKFRKAVELDEVDPNELVQFYRNFTTMQGSNGEWYFYPTVQYDEGLQRLGTNASREAAKKAISAEDRTKSAALKGTLSRLREQKKTSNPDIKQLAAALTRDGRPVPQHPGDFRAWLKKHERNGTNDLDTFLSSEAVTERRLFTEQFDRPVGKATRWAEDLLAHQRGVNRSVFSYANSQWGRNNPNGITKNRFLEGMYENDASEFMLMVGQRGSPFAYYADEFKVAGKTVPGVKTLRDLNKAYNDGRILAFEDYNLDELTTMWSDQAFNHLMKLTPEKRIDRINTMWAKSKKGRVQGAVRDKQALKDRAAKHARDYTRDSDLSNAGYRQVEADAIKHAEQQVLRYMNEGGEVASPGSTSLSLGSARRTSVPKVDAKTVIPAIRQVFGKKVAEALERKKQPGLTPKDARLIDQEIADLKKQRDKSVDRAKHSDRKARKARTEIVRLMKEEAIIRAAALANKETKSSLVYRVGNKELTVPGSQAFFDNVAKAAEWPVVKQFMDAYGATFKPPSTLLSAESKLINARAQARTPEIFRYHLNDLNRNMSHMPPRERKDDFKLWVKNPESARLDSGVRREMDKILSIVNGADIAFHTPEGGYLTLSELNRFLPPELIVGRNGYSKALDYRKLTPEDFMREISKNNYYRDNKGSSLNRTQYADPYAFGLKFRIAAEQAAAFKAMDESLGKTFGITRVGHVTDSTNFKPTKDGALIEKLRTEHGWAPIEKLNSKFLFPPQVHKEMKMMVDLMENREDVGKVMSFVDEALRVWKTSVTIYNPGYYSRNGVGEIMSSWFDGVNDPRWYTRAKKVMAYRKREGYDLDAVLTQFPDLKAAVGNAPVRSKDVIYTMDNGTTVTAEDAWILYENMGLHSNFITTDVPRHMEKAGMSLNRGGMFKRAAHKVHDSVQDVGEGFEDGLRMAHFLHAMNRAGTKDLVEAAKFARERVVKFHFDYNDFNDFEKTFMLRAFPFYKWTRKALPLMMQMLVMQPGKVMAYPKTMNAVSNLSTGDFGEDENGFAPNYEGMAPEWVQDLWAYQMGEMEDEYGYADYFRLSTPQMDTYQFASDPVGGAYSLLNPFVKAGAEQAAGRTLGSELPGAQDEMQISLREDFYGNDYSNGDEFKERLRHLMRMTPQSNLGQKLWRNSEKPEGADTNSGASVASFLTGLGVYSAFTPAVGPGEVANSTLDRGRKADAGTGDPQDMTTLLENLRQLGTR